VKPLVIIETHPVQYHAPVYHFLNDHLGVPVHVIYGSDFSIAGYCDREFGTSFAWDTELVRNSDSCTFLSRVGRGGAGSVEDVSAAGLDRALAELQPAAVLLTGYSPAFHRHAFFQAWKLGCPILFRAETTDHTALRGASKSWLRDRMLQSLYARCDRLLPIGQRSYEHYRRLGCDEHRLFFSPYCVSTNAFQCDEEARDRLRKPAREQLAIPEGSLVVLFCGKLSTRKGPHVLVEALKGLPENIRERMVTLFVGDGQQRDALDKQCTADAVIQVRFAGFKNQSELSPYYHAADVFVLPSLESETWGLVVNEALHHGAPCVVTDAVGCAPDLIEPEVTGEIAVGGSAESLRDAIKQFLPRVGTSQIREQCRQKVSGYTVEKAAEGIAKAFRSLQECKRKAAS
jgi:glycosyltransferase involved in cell wall biosynthesis